MSELSKAKVVHKEVRYETQNKRHILATKLVFEYHKQSGEYYTTEYIEKVVNQLKAYVLDHKQGKYRFYLGLGMEAGMYMPSMVLPITSKIPLFDLKPTCFEYNQLVQYDDMNKIKYHYFEINVYKDNPKRGGCDIRNDCFYYAMKSCGIHKWAQPSLLKTFLGIPRNAEVEIEHIDKIEQSLHESHIGIRIRGDYTREPKCVNPKRVIEIDLIHEHYTAHVGKIKGMIFKTKNNKPLQIYQKTEKRYKIYDGETETESNTKPHDNKIINVNISEIKRAFKKENQEETMPNYYKWLTNQIDLLKRYTKIDMYKLGWLNRCFAYKIMPIIKTKGILFEPIEQYECDYIQDGSTGAYSYCIQGTYPKLYEYDFESFYCWLLLNAGFFLPFRQGFMKHLTTQEISRWKAFQYGLYCCDIEYKEETKNIFRYNSMRGIYTHYDLNIALFLGLKITMREDIENNVLLYSKEKLFKSHLVFDEWYKTMLELKKSHPDCSLIKLLTSTNWGYLTSFKKIYTKWEKDDDSHYHCNTDIENARIYKDGKDECVLINQSKPYEFKYARWKPFILSFGRKIMFDKVLSKYGNQIKKVECDGFMTTKKIEFAPEDKIILKHEYENVEIINMRQTHGEKTI
jgi:hypothetical protein